VAVREPSDIPSSQGLELRPMVGFRAHIPPPFWRHPILNQEVQSLTGQIGFELDRRPGQAQALLDVVPR
jgi:hypothetical protein